MNDNNRQHRRIKKSLTIQFCKAGVVPKKWDQSVIENISAGGVKFIVPSDLKLQDKILFLQIKVPELAPRLLELEAQVLEAKPRSHSQYSEIRAKFINLTERNKEHLSIVEKIIELQEIKNSKKEKEIEK